jgi:hypothetical protein
MDKKVETAHNAEWGVNTMSNAYGQVIGFIWAFSELLANKHTHSVSFFLSLFL